MPAALLAAMRPQQWTKNLFVLVATIFTDNLPMSLHDAARWRTFGIAMAAFGLFCLVSGSVYLVNDIADREQDRQHPVKRNRPIASGRLPWQIAAVCAAIAGPGGVALAFLINVPFGLITAGYLVLQVLYTFVLKNLVLLDVFTIAAGFVMRAVAGGLAIRVSVTVWLLVCTLQLALFLGFGKRRHELTSLADGATDHRPILSEYSVPLLDQMMGIVLAGLIICYAIYTVTSPTAMRHHWLIMTLPNVMYGVFRYLYLVHIRHEGGAPETVLMTDRPTQVNIALYVAEAVCAFKLG